MAVVLASLLTGAHVASNPLSTQDLVGRYMKAATAYTIITALAWKYVENMAKVQPYSMVSAGVNSWLYPASFLPLPVIAILMPHYKTGK